MVGANTIVITAVPSYIGKLPVSPVRIPANNSILKQTSTIDTMDISSHLPEPNREQVLGISRKRRLDHLTMEEKVMRKKLKNRVAAQCSRERKKARMEELEAEVKSLKEVNEALRLNCDSLRLENSKLLTENQELKKKLQDSTELKRCEVHCVGCSPQVEPAVFSTNPRQKGRNLELAPMDPALVAVLWMMIFYILSQNFLKIWMQTLHSPILTNWCKASIEQHLKIWTPESTKRLWEKNKAHPMKWWGKQQQSWNPVENSQVH